jgi:hypothetical protein
MDSFNEESAASIQRKDVAQDHVSVDKEGIGAHEHREDHEIFKQDVDGVQFRTVSWQRATVIFLKIQFAMSILAVPGALATLGAVGGSLSIVAWECLNTCKSWLARQSGNQSKRRAIAG